MKYFIWIASSLMLLAMTADLAVAQAPSLNLPEIANQPLTIIFKNVTKHDQFRLVIQALKASKRVNPLVMKRAHKGFIEYEGKFFGESESLLETLHMATEGKVKIESKPKGSDGLEIVVTPKSS